MELFAALFSIFKHGRQIQLRRVVGRWLVAALDGERLREREFDLIVPVPLHPAREREHGFNQLQCGLIG